MRNNLPLLDKYERILKEDKSSVVFAPLAEIYRKSGELKKAIKICLNGLKENPDYLSGRIVLANCYYELEDFQQAYNNISKYVDTNLENILLQKLWGKINLELGNRELALNVFKKLSFLFPSDTEICELIENLEMENGDNSISLRDDEDRIIDIRNWEQKDLGAKEIKIETDQSTSIDFARLFNEMGDSQTVEHLLDSIEEKVQGIEMQDSSISDSKEDLNRTVKENNLMDYFDLKVGEIDSLLDDDVDREEGLLSHSGVHIERPNDSEEKEKAKTVAEKEITDVSEAELSTNNRVKEEEPISVSSNELIEDQVCFIRDVKQRCDNFLNLLVQRSLVATAH